MVKKMSCRILGVLLCVCVFMCGVTPAFASILMITQQPESTAVPKGELATVSITVKGEGLQYEWWYAAPGTRVFTKSDVTGSEYAVEMNESNDGLQVYCVVSDAYKHMAQTKTVTLNMVTPLEIIRQPQNAYAYAGETALVSVEATGAELTYAWWFANADEERFAQSTLTGAVYEQEMSDMRDGRKVYCVITDKFGQTVQTDTVLLIMKTPLVITQQPASVSAVEGQEALVSLAAQGDGLTYAWYVTDASGNFVADACADAQYAFAMEANGQERLAYCVVTDAYGNTVQTDAVMLNAIPAGLSYEIREEAAVITDYAGDAANLLVPQIIDGCPVTQIAENAFADCTELLQITLPDSVTTIGEGAFSGCEALTVMNLPEQLTTVGSGAFVDCDSLRCIVVPASLTALEEAWLDDLDKEQVQLGSDNAAGVENWARETGFAVKALHGGQVVYIEMPETLEGMRGEQHAISYTVFSLNGQEKQEAIVWTSSAAEIAQVDDQGVVTLLGVGIATITATAGNGVTAACMINSVCGSHEEALDEAIAATCTETGLTEGKHCAICGEVLLAQETVAALGHTEAIDEAVAATCTETGLTEGKHCAVCGEVLLAQETVAALGHTEVIDEAVAPENGHDGLTEGKHCAACGEVLTAQQVIPSAGVEGNGSADMLQEKDKKE